MHGSTRLIEPDRRLRTPGRDFRRRQYIAPRNRMINMADGDFVLDASGNLVLDPSGNLALQSGYPCGDCDPITAPCSMLVTFSGISLCGGCLAYAAISPDSVMWADGSDANQTVCLRPLQSLPGCHWAGFMPVPVNTWANNTCSGTPFFFTTALIRLCKINATDYQLTALNHLSFFYGTVSVANNDCTSPFTIANAPACGDTVIPVDATCFGATVAGASGGSAAISPGWCCC